VDTGSVSFSKTPQTFEYRTRDARRGGFFVARHGRNGLAIDVDGSADARLARADRPNQIRPGAPRASAVDRGSDSRGAVLTGQQYPQVH
jgi:hypothetical protein